MPRKTAIAASQAENMEPSEALDALNSQAGIETSATPDEEPGILSEGGENMPSPQDGIESSDIASGIQGTLLPDTLPMPQTETETGGIHEETAVEDVIDGLDGHSPQDDMESAENQPDRPSLQDNQAENMPASQDGMDLRENLADGHDLPTGNPIISQTGMKTDPDDRTYSSPDVSAASVRRKSRPAPQTEAEPAGTHEEMPGIVSEGSENAPAPQTGMKSGGDGPESGSQGYLPADATPVSQTGTEADGDEPGAAAQCTLQADISPAPQTGIGSAGDEPGYAVPAPLQQDTAPVSQTGMESGTDDPGSAAQGTLQKDEPPVSQAEVKSGDDESGSDSQRPLQQDLAPVSQTGIESDTDDPGSAALGTLQKDTAPVSQTGIESDENMAEGDGTFNPIPAEPPASQTGSESASPDENPRDDIRPKPGRRAAKSQSGEKAETPELPDADQEPSPKPARRRRPRAEPVLSIDEQRTVETSEDKMRNDLLDLVESLKSRKILSGAIQGIERSADNPNISFAVIYHGAFKVIIPADEVVQPPADLRGRSHADVMHYLVTKRLGAEVDYIIKGIDAKTGIAAASRLEAMALKRRQYYFGTDRDGNNLIYEGLSAEARVVSVIRAGIFVDLFGLETYIALLELSYQRWIDAAAHFQPGQRVLVRVMALDRSDRDNIRVSASVKQAGENPYEQALKRYTPGSRYVGTVSMVDTNGVFVSLDGGIDCLCSYPKRGRPPRGARVTVRIIGVNHDNNRIWGAITHMATAR